MTAPLHPPTRHAVRPSAAVYRRRRIVAALLLVAVLAVGSYLPLTLLAPLPTVAAQVVTPEPETIDVTELAWPSYGAGALGVVELPDVLEQRGSEKARPLASITKLVTALTVLDAHPLTADEEGPAITLSSRDVALYGRYLALNGKVLPVQAGQRFSERELLEVALIESSNNHATSLAIWAFGSEEAFVEAATAFLTRHSLDSIRIVEPTGIDPANVGTTADLVALGKIALGNPVIAQIVSTRTTTVDNVGEIENTNSLVGRDGVTGIKTGTLTSAGANLLFSAAVPVDDDLSVTVVGVVLGAPDHATLAKDVRRLLATARERVHVVTLATAGEVIGHYETIWGDSAELIVAEDVEWLTWGDQEVHASVTTEELAVARDNEDVGLLAFQAVGTAGVTLEAPLVLADGIEDPGPWWRLSHPGLIVGAP